MPGVLLAVIGDSNANNQGDVDKASPEYRVAAPTPDVQYEALLAVGSNDPPPFVQYGPGPLQPLNIAGQGSRFGFEITLGRRLLAEGMTTYVTKMAISGVATAQWAPASTYMLASTGKNLYTTWRDRMRSLEAYAGLELGIVVVNAGGNDAVSADDTRHMQANMTALCNQIWNDFGNDVVILWLQTHALVSLIVAPHRDEVIAAEEVAAIAMTNPNFRLVNIDRAKLLSDQTHYDADSLLWIGELVAFAALRIRGVAAATVAGPAPTIVGYGTVDHGSGNLSPRPWPGTVAGDTLELFAISGWLSGTPTDIPTPPGWTLKASGSSTAIGVTEEYALFERAIDQAELDANGGLPAPVIVICGGSENIAQIFTARGPTPFPSIVDAAAISGNDTIGMGPVSAPGVTPTPRSRVLFFMGGFTGSLGDAITVTNANVAGISKVKDGQYLLPDTNFVDVSLDTGTASGPTGPSQVSAARNTIIVGITAALASLDVAALPPPAPAPGVVNPGARGALGLVFDPVTRDLIDSPDGWFVEGTDSRSAVLWQLESRYQAWWGSPFDGSRIAAILGGDDPADAQDVRDEALRAMQALVADGIISELAVALDTDPAGRVVVILAYRDLASGRLVDLAYVPFGG